jgi:hypothetical protein
MTQRTGLVSLTLAAGLVACSTGAPTEHEVETGEEAATASAQICQNVFDAAVAQGTLAPQLTLTWIKDDRATVAQSDVGLDTAGRVVAQGGNEGATDGLDPIFTLVFRKRFITLPSGARIPQSSVLDFELVTPQGSTLATFTSVPTECVTRGNTVIVSAAGADGSRAVLSFTRFSIIGG